MNPLYKTILECCPKCRCKFMNSVDLNETEVFTCKRCQVRYLVNHTTQTVTQEPIGQGPTLWAQWNAFSAILSAWTANSLRWWWFIVVSPVNALCTNIRAVLSQSPVRGNGVAMYLTFLKITAGIVFTGCMVGMAGAVVYGAITNKVKE